MASTLELYDGSTRLDFLDDTNYSAVTFFLGPPQMNPSLAGTELRRIQYLPRSVNILLTLKGSSLTNLVANERAIVNMLRVAERRQVHSQGTKVILDYQLGDTGSADLSWRVISGQLILPENIADAPLVNQFYIVEATLELLVEPFARLAAVSPSPGTLENEQEGANLNYMDIDSIAGTSGALLELKIHDTNNGGGTPWSGSKTMWIAIRTGERKTDAVFLQTPNSVVEVLDPSVDDDLTAVMATTGGVSANASGGASAKMNWTNETGSESAISNGVQFAAYAQYDIAAANLPKGRFRVLVRWTATEVAGTVPGSIDIEDLGVAFGYVFGGKTVTPTAGDETLFVGTDSEFQIVDFGELVIPPLAVPGGSGVDPTLNLRVYAVTHTETTEGVGWGGVDGEILLSIDSVMLLPVDEGVVIVDSVATADRILISNKEDAPGVWILDTSDVVQEFATFNGGPFNIGPEDTRIFVVRDDVGDPTTNQFTVTPIYTPLVQGI